MSDRAPIDARSDARSDARILALGDSYTIGEGVDADDRWVHRLRDALLGRGVAVATPRIIARTGWTTDELTAAIAAAQVDGPFDLVTLLIGVNDQYRGRPVDAYQAALGPLVDRAVAFATGRADRVMVLSIPDWGVTPFAAGRDRAAIAAAIDAYNAVNRRAAEVVGAHYVDVTASSRAAGGAGDASLLASDGLHPAAAMYREWARLALPVALQVLRGDER